MTDREISNEPKNENAIGIMKSVIFKQDNDRVKFFIRKGGQAKIHNHFMSFFANRMGFEGRPKP
jgi:uncharacterized protein YneR